MKSLLSPAEQTIFHKLRSNPGTYVPKTVLETALYGSDAERPKSNTIEVFIGRLRKRGMNIECKKQHGYKLASLHIAELSLLTSGGSISTDSETIIQ